MWVKDRGCKARTGVGRAGVTGVEEGRVVCCGDICEGDRIVCSEDTHRTQITKLAWVWELM